MTIDDIRQRITVTYTVVYNTKHVPDDPVHLQHLFESWLRSKGATIKDGEIEL